MTENTCCVFGHREIEKSEELRARLGDIIEELIACEGVDTFLFGSKSRFNDLCYELVTAAKQKHPHIKRVYVRAEYPQISEDYRNYILQSYEDTYYCSEKAADCGKAAYVERNCKMIDSSRICIVYYTGQGTVGARKSGTEIAFKYAVKHGRKIINTAI